MHRRRSRSEIFRGFLCYELRPELRLASEELLLLLPRNDDPGPIDSVNGQRRGFPSASTSDEGFAWISSLSRPTPRGEDV